MTFTPVRNVTAPKGVAVKAPSEEVETDTDTEQNVGTVIEISSVLEPVKIWLSQKEIQLPAKFVLVFIIMTFSFLLVFLSIYAYVLRIRRERKRKERDRRRRRQMALEAGSA